MGTEWVAAAHGGREAVVLPAAAEELQVADYLQKALELAE